jgi:hypothetical protein
MLLKMTTSTLSLFSAICKPIAPEIQSLASAFWQFIMALWPWHWMWIAPLLLGWIIFEIATRNGNWHYNSKNGFSPAFNIVVGSGTYLLIQTLTYFLLKLALGDAAYCNPIAYFVHIFTFISTGGLLFFSGFWVYWKFPGRRR